MESAIYNAWAYVPSPVEETTDSTTQAPHEPHAPAGLTDLRPLIMLSVHRLVRLPLNPRVSR